MHTLRHATPADKAQVCEVWDVAGITAPWNDPPNDFDLALRTPTSTIIVAEDARIDGVIMPGFDGHRGWIHMVGIRPEAQRKGIGHLLVDDSLAYLKSLGAPAVHLLVAPQNAGGMQFWERQGFFLIDPLVWAREL